MFAPRDKIKMSKLVRGEHPTIQSQNLPRNNISNLCKESENKQVLEYWHFVLHVFKIFHISGRQESQWEIALH